MNLPGVEILSVTNFNFDKENAEKHHHLVQLSSDSPTSDLLKVKSLAYQWIRWERLRKPLLYQCRRCQRIGHSGKNCHLEFRCVKCAEPHGPGKCPIETTSGKEALKCSNCGQTGHPTSYRGCPYMKLAIGTKRNQQRTSKATVQQKIDRIAPIQANRTFAQATRTHTAARTTPPWRATPTTREQFPALPRQNNDIINEVNQSAPEQQPNWLKDLKNDLASIISEQLQAISTQIAHNSARIDFILNALGNK